MLRRSLALLSLASLIVWLPACASTPEAPPQRRPQEFVLSATVYAPSRPTGAGAAERALRPGRYIVEADGVLRAALGPGATTTTYPRQTRQLSPDQLDALWRALLDSGVLESPDATRVPNAETYTPPAGRTTAVVYAAWRDRRETVAVPLDRHRGARSLVDLLAELAWVPR